MRIDDNAFINRWDLGGGLLAGAGLRALDDLEVAV